MPPKIRNQELLYPELSYKIVGIAFRVYNTLGWGLREAYYQRAFKEELMREHIGFQEQKIIKLNYGRKTIATLIPDFVIKNKIIIDLKVQPKLGYTHIKQVMSYLKASQLKLAMVIYFTAEGVTYRRIINASSEKTP